MTAIADDRPRSTVESSVLDAIAEFEWTTGPEAFAAAVSTVASTTKSKIWMEIGGGRSPLTSRNTIVEQGIDFTISDIDQDELDAGPDYASKRQLDIADPGLTLDAQYDIVFSRYVLEHVKNGDAAHANCAALLKSGGVALHLIPTLFSPPFVLNKVIPEAASGWVLNKLAARPLPKFPAWYSCCSATSRTRKRILDAGFSEVHIVPLYWHNYFDRVPVVRNLSHGLNEFARRRSWRWLASTAYVVAVK